MWKLLQFWLFVHGGNFGEKRYDVVPAPVGPCRSRRHLGRTRGQIELEKTRRTFAQPFEERPGRLGRLRIDPVPGAQILEVVGVGEAVLLRDALDPAAETDAGELLLRGVAFGSRALEAFAQPGEFGVIAALELFRLGKGALLELLDPGFEFAVAFLEFGGTGVAGRKPASRARSASLRASPAAAFPMISIRSIGNSPC